jgi:DNA-binding beta-propeller fold protein YncE
MKKALFLFMRVAGLVLAAMVLQADAADTASLPVNPVTKRQHREAVFEFAQKPAIEREGDRYVISFATRGRCDATVAIVDEKGRIVRHLASGVLGENAPAPFTQGSLSQKIEWDGRNDAGETVPPGCRVRIGLGLKADFDRLIGWDPRKVGLAKGLVCDSRGNLYVIRESNDLVVQVFDRNGRYLRTLAPFPATMPPEKLSLVKFTRTTDGRTVPVVMRSGGGSSVYLFHRYLTGMTCQTPVLTPQTPVVTPDGGELFLVTGGYRTPRRLIRLGTDGSLSSDDVITLNLQSSRKPKHLVGSGDLHMALSPDGTYVYFGSPAGGRAAEQHAVWRKKISGLRPADVKKRAAINPPELFLGEMEKGKSGDDETHFNGPRGVACDATGALYVADCANNRIQVFDDKGGFLRSIPAESPDQIAVHPKTGNIYVIPSPSKKKSKTGTYGLTKLDKDGKSLAVFPVNNKMAYRQRPVFCLDSSGEDPAVWVQDGSGLRKVVDRGETFEEVANLGTAVQEKWAQWKMQYPSLGKHGYIVADPKREEVYLRTGGVCQGTPFLRIDGRAGKLNKYDSSRVSEIDFGPDGMGYARADARACGACVVRFNPDSDKIIPFENMGESMECRFLKTKATGIRIPVFGGHTRSFQDGFCVAPNGDICVVVDEAQGEFWQALREIGQAKNLADPKKPSGRLTHLGFHNAFLQVYAPDGSCRHISALPGLKHCCGIRVSRSGKVYLAISVKPAAQAAPDGIASKSPSMGTWGTLVCFDSEFGTFPFGRLHGTYETKTGKGPHTHVRAGKENIWIDNVRWEYGGMAPITDNNCVCGNSRFDLDCFDRAFVPAMQTYSVNVLDANGNLVVRIGSYGNADSLGPDSPVIDPKTGLLRPKRPDDPENLKPPKELSESIGLRWAPYVAVTDEAIYAHDVGNNRVVRCVLSYEAEENLEF